VILEYRSKDDLNASTNYTMKSLNTTEAYMTNEINMTDVLTTLLLISDRLSQIENRLQFVDFSNVWYIFFERKGHFMITEWKVKIWENDTALNYLYELPHADIWSIPLEDWVYHSVAECAILYCATTGLTSEICEALTAITEMEEIYNNAVKSVKKAYADKTPLFAKHRLAVKINDLLTLMPLFPSIIKERSDIWMDAIECLADEIDDAEIVPEGTVKFRKKAQYIC